tara:strand:+ start:954 stop:1622 length:669 start_codon:yes stop_codon:yes gene_type:complete
MDKYNLKKNLYGFRENYQKRTLSLNDLEESPTIQFEKWLKEAIDENIKEPNAMVLSTIGQKGPNIRSVLLKEFNEDGFIFFTNYKSIKGQDINKNKSVGLLFPWYQLERQVVVLGKAKKIDEDSSLEYFNGRPFESKLGAWVSDQSKVINNRKYLEERWISYRSKFKGKEIPKPAEWGGYIVEPSEIEFWQGRERRLHDRFRYIKQYKDGGNYTWEINRLSP